MTSDPAGTPVADASTILPIADAATTRAAVGRLMRNHRGEIARVVLSAAAQSLSALAGPLLLGRVVDIVGTDRDLTRALPLLIAMPAFLILQAAFAYAYASQATRFGERAFAELRERFIEDVTALPLSVVENAGTGDLLSRTTGDIDNVSTTIRYALPELVVATTTVVLTVVLAFFVQPMVAIALLIGAPSMIVAARWYLRRAPRGYREQREAYGRLSGVLSETIDGARAVTTLSLASRRDLLLDECIRRCYRTVRYTLRLRTVFFPATSLSFGVPVIVVLGWGGWLAAGGVVTAGSVATIALYGMQLSSPVESLVLWLDRLQTGVASLARIVGLGMIPADRTPTVADVADDTIELRDAHFAYHGGRNVLHGVDLVIRPGERLAIVGSSGAGKSTLARLIAGIHAPLRGSATIGGVPLTALPIDELRSHVALVTQEHHVFIGTVEQNLRLARPEASDAQLRDALEQVGARDWVSALPDGLNTIVGSGGHRLTDAQAQELAIARLLIAGPRTLVLDEATSLLDVREARRVENTLGALLHGRTVVAIAHRLHTARDADRIAVVERGRIVELGTHDDLLADGGHYAALWRSWHGEHDAATIEGT